MTQCTLEQALAPKHEAAMTFRPAYLGVATTLFVVEVAIARGYIPGTFVRNSVGDALVIALLYFCLRGMTKWTLFVTLVVALAIGLTAEILQYLQLADLLGLKKGGLTYILLGNTFSWSDLVMYGLGGGLAIWLDARVIQNRYAPRDAPAARRS